MAIVILPTHKKKAQRKRNGTLMCGSGHFYPFSDVNRAGNRL